MNLLQSPSPNFSSRGGYTIKGIVIHCTDGNYPGDLEWLTSSVSEVSSHYLIAPNGDIHQLVDDKNAAWHSGKIFKPTASILKTYDGVNPNSYLLGIEVSVKASDCILLEQSMALLELLKHLTTTHSIPLDREHVIGHKEIRSNKTCPGTINVDDIVHFLRTNIVAEDTEYSQTIKNKIKQLLDLL